ncbi:hypothetical protein KEM48_009547 [Puccinia striiformis f. sp. tritici PST-130]|nr:hypothetical protein KEM48_009547 [Puccinia striiformis f. sp. tritici PST-130]
MAVEERVPNQVSRSTQSRTEVRDTADSESSGDESPNVSQPTSNPPKQRQHLAAVVVPRDNRRELKSPPKKMARVTKSSTRRAPQIDRVLPGGFNLDDEEMDEPSPAAPEETNESSAEASKAQSRSNHYQPTNRSSTTTRKKTRGDNQNHDNNNQVQRSTGTATVPPITPRRSNRLTTPAKRRVLPGGMIDHDSIDEDDDDQRLPQEPQNSKKTPLNLKLEKSQCC